MTQESTTGSGAGDQTTRAVVSNLNGTTFFSQAARMGWETTPRSAAICGLAGKFRTGETA